VEAGGILLVSTVARFLFNNQWIGREKTMASRSGFHLDCTSIIAECGRKCDRCIEEMKSVFGKMQGVSRFYREGHGVVVEHDSSVVAVEQLMDVFRSLPSFYQSRFIPSVLENPEGQG
jgi:hypothetical protein